MGLENISIPQEMKDQVLEQAGSIKAKVFQHLSKAVQGKTIYKFVKFTTMNDVVNFLNENKLRIVPFQIVSDSSHEYFVVYEEETK